MVQVLRIFLSFKTSDGFSLSYGQFQIYIKQITNFCPSCLEANSRCYFTCNSLPACLY